MRLNQIVSKYYKTIFILLALISISLLPRLWQLTINPPLIIDEPANLRDINQLIHLGGFHPFNFHWDFSQSTLFHYPTILLIYLGADDLQALRLTSVIISSLSLIPFYFIIKKRTNSVIATCTTLLFSFSYYYLQFSRVGWTNIHTIFLGLILFWILDEAISRKSYKLIFLSTIIASLLFHTYRAGEIFILAGLIYIVFSFGEIKKINTKFISSLIYISFTFIFSLPWIYIIISNWELFNLRTSVVSILNVEKPYHGLYENLEIFIYQIFTTFKSWILMLPIYGGGIENQRYLPINKSLVSFPIALLFIFGLGIAIGNVKKHYIWLIILLLGLVLGQIMTINPPNGARGLILLPIIYIIASLTLFYIYKKIEKYKYTKFVFILLSLIIALFDFYFYTQWMTWISV